MEQVAVLAPVDPIPVTTRSERTSWSVTITPGVAVHNHFPDRSVVVAGVLFARYGIGQRAEERLTLVRLVKTGLLTQKELARRWGIARKTLGNWVAAYEAHGVEGLLDPMPAAVRATMAEELRQAAEAVLRSHPDASIRERNRLLAAQGHGMLRERDWVAIRRSLGIWGQVEFDVDTVQVTEETASTAGPADVNAVATEALVEEAAAAGTVTEAPSATAATPGVGAAGEVPAGAHFSRYAGLALLLPLMAALLAPILGRLRHLAEAGPRWRWRPDELLQALLLYMLAGHLNPEQTKLAARRQMGWLLGHSALPSCATLRRWLGTLHSQRLHRWIPLELARQYLRLGWVEMAGWFIDGHFVPYHGQGKLTKAWWTQRRLAHRGHHQYWVNDRRGRPLVAFLAQGFQVFAHMLPVVAASLRALLRSVGADGVPVIVFDRGGYSARLFRTLDRMGVGWVTWRKAAVSLAPELFTGAGTLETVHRPPRPIRYAVTRMRVQGYRCDVLAVAWHEGNPSKQVALLANVDRLAPEQYTPLELIRLLEGRWSQENYFQTAERRQGLNWLDGYEIEPMDRRARVPNPERVAAENRLAYLEPVVARYREKLAALRERFLRRKRRGDWARFLAQKGNQKLLARYRALVTAYREAKDRRRTLPGEVPYLSLHEGQRDVLRLERGAVVVAARAAAWHLRQRLLLMAEPFFPDYRERSKFVDVLLHGGGWWHRAPDGLHVVLKAPETPAYYRAALRLLDHWNRTVGAGAVYIQLETRPALQHQKRNDQPALDRLCAEP